MIKVLALVASALAAIIVIEIALPDPRSEAPQRVIALPPSVAPAVPAQPTNERVAVILARPLFSPTRRPDPASAGPASLPRLTGVVITPAARAALFEPADAGRLLILHEGDRIGPLVIRAIAPGMVDAAGADGPVRMRVSWGPTKVLAIKEPPPKVWRELPTAHSREVSDGRQE